MSNEITALMLHLGDLQAERAARRGMFVGRTISQLGQIPAQQQQQRVADQALSLKQQEAQSTINLRNAQIAETNAQAAERVAQTSKAGEAETHAKNLQAVGKSLVDIASLPDPLTQATSWTQMRSSLIQSGVWADSDAPKAYPGIGWVKAHAALALGQHEQLAKQLWPDPEKPDLMTVNPGDSVVDKRNPGAGPMFTAPPKPDPLAADRLADNARADATATETARHNRAMEASARARAAAANGSTDVKDAEAIAEAIASGEQPPITTGLFRLAGPVRAALAKKGFNLSTANLDWTATQKHISTMNNAQQLRLTQSINALPDLLDSVDTLASQWKGGRFPILNKANLALAKGGAYGSDVASVARKLDTQIADVVGDLGSVYMGGNSPTDQALDLAKTALAGEWDEKVLRDMVAQAKSNVRIRKNSILNTGVSGASAGNAYAPAPPAAAKTIRARDPQGVLHEAPAGTALPAGWKLEP